MQENDKGKFYLERIAKLKLALYLQYPTSETNYYYLKKRNYV